MAVPQTSPVGLGRPAARVDLAKTSAEPLGTEVSGILNNCAGGVAPWGTVATGEENVDQHFADLTTLGEDAPPRPSVVIIQAEKATARIGTAG